MSTREKLSSPFTKDNKRSDSPGYFTLSSNSGSDTGDCTGDISCEEDEELIHLRQHDSSLSHHCNDDNFADSSSSTIVYNFQNSLNTSDEKNRGLARISRENTASPSRKNTPPVNVSNIFSSVKTLNKHVDDAPPTPPPRPPPPFSYTSTLPPPVPKKINTHSNSARSHSLHQQRSYAAGNTFPRQPSAPPTARNQQSSLFQQKPKPLQRVQPLQIQSPSVINALKQGMSIGNSSPRLALSSGCSESCDSTYTSSSSEDNPFSSLESQCHEDDIMTHQTEIDLDVTKTELQSSTHPNFWPSNASKDEYIIPNQPIRQNRSLSKVDFSQKKPLSKDNNIQDDFLHEKNEMHDQDNANEYQSVPIYSTCSSRSNSALSNSSGNSIDNSTTPIKTYGNARDKLTTSSLSSHSQSSPLQNAKRCVIDKVSAFTRSKAKTTKTKSQNQKSNNRKSQENTTKISTKLNPSKFCQKRHNIEASLDSREVSSEKDKNEKLKTEKDNFMRKEVINQEHYQPNNNYNLAQTRSKSSQQKKRQSLHNSIYNLIKCYEPDFTRNKTILASEENKHEKNARKIDRSRSSSSEGTTISDDISNTLSARLSQLSIESLERINSWLLNPIDSTSPTKNNPDVITYPNTLSVIEIDILDQCVNDLIKFTQGTLEDGSPRVKSTTRYSIVEMVKNGVNSARNEDKENIDEPKFTVQQLVSKIEHELSLEIDELNTSIILTNLDDSQMIDVLDDVKETRIQINSSVAGNVSQDQNKVGHDPKEPQDRNANQPSKHVTHVGITDSVSVIKNKDYPLGLPKVDNKKIEKKITESFSLNDWTPQNTTEKFMFNNKENCSSLSQIGEKKDEFKGENIHVPTKSEATIHQSQSLSHINKAPKPDPNFLLQNLGKQPIPSPRVKRKARKEKMLQEHKALGKQAILTLKDKSILNSTSESLSSKNLNTNEGCNAMTVESSSDVSTELTASFSYHDAFSTCTTPSLALTRHSNSTLTDDDTLKTEVAEITINNLEETDNGLDVLEDLCTQSRLIQRALTATPNSSLLHSTFSHTNTNDQFKDVSEISNSVRNGENEQSRTKVRIQFINGVEIVRQFRNT